MVAGTNQMKDDDIVDATSTVAARKVVVIYWFLFLFPLYKLKWLASDAICHSFKFLQPKTEFTPEKQNATSKKLFVGCLPNEVKRANLYVQSPVQVLQIYFFISFSDSKHCLGKLFLTIAEKLLMSLLVYIVMGHLEALLMLSLPLKKLRKM